MIKAYWWMANLFEGIPMKVTVELSTNVVKVITSPLYYVVSALTGISMTFCLMWIYELGKKEVGGLDPRVVLNVTAIWLVHGVFQAVAFPVIKQVREQGKSHLFRSE